MPLISLASLPPLCGALCLCAAFVDCLWQVVAPIVNHVSQLVELDSDRLSDFGSDRTYNTYNCLVNINLPRIIHHHQDALCTHMRVRVHTGMCI